jgi:hypothetical protein
VLSMIEVSATVSQVQNAVTFAFQSA